MLLHTPESHHNFHDHHESQSVKIKCHESYSTNNPIGGARKGCFHKKCLLVIAVLIFSAASISIRWWRITDRSESHAIHQQGWPAENLVLEKSSQSRFVAEDNDVWSNRLRVKRVKRQETTGEKVLEDHITSNETTDQITLSGQESNTTELDCEEAAFLEFPPDLFNQFLRSHGFIVVHILVSCYMFYCLAVVCDNYFLPSLEECSHRLGLSDDVAGATFMAAGSSAPELFTALIGVFVAKGDVGTGTIVGSAVFNILFVIGLCGCLAKAAHLNWWPVFRDSSFYALAVLILTGVIWDGEVGYLESGFMMILYLVYIVIMKFNVELRELLVSRVDVTKFGLQVETEEQFSTDMQSQEDEMVMQRNQQQPQQNYQSTGPAVQDPSQDPWSDTWSAPPAAQSNAWTGDSWGPQQSLDVFPSSAGSSSRPVSGYIPPSEDPKKTSLFEAANRQILKHRRLFRPRTRFIAAANLIIIQNRKSKTSTKLQSRKKAGPSRAQQKRVMTQIRQETTRKPSIAPDPEEILKLVPNPMVVGWLPVIKWCLNYPLDAALFYTIPDCRKKPAFFLVSFFMSILWTAIFSYIMVWMVTIVGFTFGIPDSVMGITLLAAGTSIPDAYASVHVARAGQADMAVSNSIGSNVFDILIGLALPWFLETAVVRPGSHSTVKSRGLTYAVLLLFLTLFAAVSLLHLNKWMLDRKIGIVFLLVYGLFVVFASALEFNLLGNFNPPTCPVPDA